MQHYRALFENVLESHAARLEEVPPVIGNAGPRLFPGRFPCFFPFEPNRGAVVQRDRHENFIIGVWSIFGAVPLVGFLYVKLGFLSLATTAKPFPFEAFLRARLCTPVSAKAKDVTDKFGS